MIIKRNKTRELTITDVQITDKNRDYKKKENEMKERYRNNEQMKYKEKKRIKKHKRRDKRDKV